MSQVNPPQCDDGLAPADAPGGSSDDDALDRWLTGQLLRTLDEFRVIRRRLEADCRRLCEEGRQLREELRGNG